MTIPYPHVEDCPRCLGEGVVAGPQICPACNGSRLRVVKNIRPRGEPKPWAPLAKCEPAQYPAPMTDRADVRRVLVSGERRYVLEVVRGARMVETQITRRELEQLRDAASVLLAMED